MAERRALWVSTSTETRGGISSYVREMQQTTLWTDWNIRHVVTHRDGSAATKIATYARGALLFVVELIRFRPSVVHLHASARGSFIRKAALFWVSRPARVPIVMHMHGSAFAGFYESSPRLFRAVIRATLCRASAFVALGEMWSDRIQTIAPTARIISIPNAVRLAPRAPQPEPGEPVRVVFLGRIGDHKGTFRLLDAWAALAGDLRCGAGFQSAATLTLAGDGEVERARRRIRELGLEDTVEVHSWLSESDVGKLLDQAHVLVLPSRNEGQPMAILEAMARGVCVLASEVGGIPEMIGDECGVLIPPEDTDAIEAALRLVVHDKELRAGRGAAAHARAANRFDVGVVAQRLDALYREVAR